MHPTELKTIAESLIFAAGNPVSLRRLSEVMGVTPAEIKPAISLLRQEYQASGRGIIFAEVAGGYQFRTAPDNAEYVRVLLQEKPGRLSRAALETLAIIAYRQPITKLEIESVRGVTIDGVVHSLLTKNLIREMGRKDVPGRPWVYGTTPQFLELFGLSDLNDLPPLPDIHEPSLNPLADQALDDTSSIANKVNDDDHLIKKRSSFTLRGEPHAQDIPSPKGEAEDAPTREANGQETTPDQHQLSGLPTEPAAQADASHATTSAAPAQAVESSRSEFTSKSRDADPGRQGPGQRPDDHPAGDDGGSET